MWYYAVGEERQGPIALGELQHLIQRGTLGADTYVWTEGMPDWAPAGQTPELAASFQQPGGAIAYATGARLPDVERLNNLYKWWLISWIGGALLMVVCVGFIGIVAGVVLYCMILHKCWSLIPRDRARTSPDTAVGLMFVPLFNFYWIFVAIHGLAVDLNKLQDQIGLSGPRANEKITLTYCILTACSPIPYLGMLAALGGVVLSFMAIYQIKNAAIAVIQHQAGGREQIPFAQPI